ncbi:MlaD family protein [Haloechinothrix salitolerans]|uniref:MlaD family protein n=1 Tax=Haloechinothrix salitolerans TaxID=926830 RepID=A0ABW2BVJ9_9PSEU
MAGIALILYLAVSAHTGLPWQESTTVRAAFTDTHSLMEGNEVRQNSVRIGSVSDIEYRDGRALVTMRLDGEHDVYGDARAEIWDFSSLGAKFVELYPGNPEAGRLADGTIPVAKTTSSADIHELFDVLDDRSRAAATSAIRELGGGAGGRSRDVRDFVRSAPDLADDLGSLSLTLSSDQTNLIGLLRSGDQLASRFAGRSERISKLVEQADSTLRALTIDDAGPLTETLRDLPGTLASLDGAFDALDTPLSDTRSAVARLRPGARALARAENDLRGVLRESVEPFAKVPAVATRATPAVGDLTGTFADARPLAKQVTRGFDDLAEPLSVLAPYAPEMGQFFVRGHSWTSQSIDGVNYARLGIVSPVLRTAGGLLGPSSVPQNVYPKPGEADHDRATGLLGGPR